MNNETSWCPRCQKATVTNEDGSCTLCYTIKEAYLGNIKKAKTELAQIVTQISELRKRLHPQQQIILKDLDLATIHISSATMQLLKEEEGERKPTPKPISHGYIISKEER